MPRLCERVSSKKQKQIVELLFLLECRVVMFCICFLGLYDQHRYVAEISLSISIAILSTSVCGRNQLEYVLSVFACWQRGRGMVGRWGRSRQKENGWKADRVLPSPHLAEETEFVLRACLFVLGSVWIICLYDQVILGCICLCMMSQAQLYLGSLARPRNDWLIC